MKIIVKTAKELSPTEYKSCYSANYGEGGYMQDALWNARYSRYEALVLMLWDGDPLKTSSLIGWSLMTPVTTRGPLQVNRYVMSKSKYTAQFWVKRQHRKRGYGKILLDEVKKYDSNPHVMPHDKASGELFSTSSVQVMKDDKRWMVKKPLALLDTDSELMIEYV